MKSLVKLIVALSEKMSEQMVDPIGEVVRIVLERAVGQSGDSKGDGDQVNPAS